MSFSLFKVDVKYNLKLLVTPPTYIHIFQILFKAPESLVNLFPKAIRLDNNYITQPQSKSSSTSLQQLSFTDLHCCEMKLHGRERWLAAVVGQIVFVFAWSGGGNL